MMLPPLIALEEHFDSEISTHRDALHANMPAHVGDRLANLSGLRIQEMDQGGQALQVISHTGMHYSPAECVEANDKLAAACKIYPGRMAGFAMLPMQDPSAAANELERCVRQLKFLGALINNHLADGTMFDDEKFWPVFAKAVELDVPIYLHPTFPGTNLEDRYSGNFSSSAAVMMSASSWGWHSETGLHVLRLFAAGLFDRFPSLKLILGHMGEMLPMLLPRIIRSTRAWGTYKRDLGTVWKENVWVTTSGIFALPQLELLLKVCDKQRVMFSLDYPFSSPDMGRDFVSAIEANKVLEKDDLEGFCHGNAEKLLGITLQ